MRLFGVLIRPPLAFARLGSASTPLDNYRWEEDPTVHGAARNVIVPTTTLEVLQDGSLAPFIPEVIRFREQGVLRPVAPFFEVWARVEGLDPDPPAAGGDGSGDQPATRLVPLTLSLMRELGIGLSDVAWSIQLGNRKAARRTGDESCAYVADVLIRGDDFKQRPLLALSPARPRGAPLVGPENPIPLGLVQVIRPRDEVAGGVDLGVLRMRFTPAKGYVYGPAAAVVAQDDGTGRSFTIVPPANRVLTEGSAWQSYDASYTAYQNPEPSDTYDGADQDAQLAWGVVDDTCDGVVEVRMAVDGQLLRASARVVSGPPDFAPDRRPFFSLADDLGDRELEPAETDRLLEDEPATQERLGDLFSRIWETASLLNLDAIRSRALYDDSYYPPVHGDGLPRVDDGSMRPQDAPFADEKVQALVPEDGTSGSIGPTFTPLADLAHDQLAEEDELVSFLVERPDRLIQMVRPPYGAFADLEETVAADAQPNPRFRDPRVLRDRMHDMRMPPYMRDEMGSALGLTRRQVLELLRYAEAVSGARAEEPAQTLAAAAITADVSTSMSASSQDMGGPRRPVRRRVQRRLERRKAGRPNAAAPEPGTEP